MNEEAGFIAALAEAPDDRTTLLVYADWLTERGEDPRAEGMRLLAAPKPNWKRIAELSSSSPAAREWVIRFKCGCGSVVRLGGQFDGMVGQVIGVYPNTDKIVVAVRVLFMGGLIDVEVESSLIDRP